MTPRIKQPPAPSPNKAEEIHALAEALRQIARDWPRHEDKLHQAGLALANLREAVLLGAFPGARFAELRVLITEDGPRRLRRRLRIETTELPGVVIAGWLQRKQMMPAWFDLPSFLWEPAVYEVLADLIEPDAGPIAPASTPAMPCSAGTASVRRITWQEAARRAEDHLRRNPFPGVRTLARIAGCSPATMMKAIKRSTALRSRRPNANESGRPNAPRTVPLTEGHLRGASGQSTATPADETTVGLDDLTVAALIDEAMRGSDAAGRAQLKRMSIDDRRRYAQILAADPDLAPVRERSSRSRGR